MENGKCKSELPEGPKYDFFHDYVHKDDPSDQNNVFYSAAVVIGYPLAFTEIIPDERGYAFAERYVRVMAQDSIISGKLKQLSSLKNEFSTDALIGCTSQGYTTTIFELLKGDEEKFLSVNPSIKVKRPLDKRVLEECFMRALEREIELAQRVHFPIEVSSEEFALYNQLKEQGVRPITPEAMIIIEVQDLREILDTHPELAP